MNHQAIHGEGIEQFMGENDALNRCCLKLLD